MGDESVTDEGDPHIAANDVVGGGQLVHLQLNFRRESGLLTNHVHTDAGIIAVPQGDKAILHKITNIDSISLCKQLATLQNVMVFQCKLLQSRRNFGAFGYGKQQHLRGEQLLAVDFFIHWVIVQHQIEVAV